MVRKADQTIEVFGARFVVKADKPITPEQEGALVKALEEFPPHIVKMMAAGT